jgi:hypothetical protein
MSRHAYYREFHDFGVAIKVTKEGVMYLATTPDLSDRASNYYQQWFPIRENIMPGTIHALLEYWKLRQSVAIARWVIMNVHSNPEYPLWAALQGFHPPTPDLDREEKDDA